MFDDHIARQGKLVECSIGQGHPCSNRYLSAGAPADISFNKFREPMIKTCHRGRFDGNNGGGDDDGEDE